MSMRPELSLQNYVKDRNTGEPIRIIELGLFNSTVIQDIDVYTLKYDDIIPIKLTEEIIIDCGFKATLEGYQKENICIQENVNLRDLFSFRIKIDKKHHVHVRNIKYIHELQNVFYFTTGEYLDIKL